jgi:ribosomal-protein-alanine N-acetyltransferase
MCPLLTPRLRLRLPEIADAPFILKLLNDPLFVRCSGDRHIRGIAAAETYIRERLLTVYEKHRFTLLVVETLAADRPIGMCGFVQRPHLDAPDLGFGFFEKDCRQGYGFEAATACMKFGRATLKLRRIYALTSVKNVACLRLLQKLEFHQEYIIENADREKVEVLLVNEP